MRASDRRVLEAVDPDFERGTDDVAALVGGRAEVIGFVLRRLAHRGWVAEGARPGRWLRTSAGDDALDDNDHQRGGTP